MNDDQFCLEESFCFRLNHLHFVTVFPNRKSQEEQQIRGKLVFISIKMPMLRTKIKTNQRRTVNIRNGLKRTRKRNNVLNRTELRTTPTSQSILLGCSVHRESAMGGYFE